MRSIAASRLTKNSPTDCFCLYEAVPYSQTQLVLPEFDYGRLYMNWMLFFTVATFFVTTISTIYVVLSFYKKDKE